MRGFNKVILMGNLTRDPELRYTVSRRAFLRFSIAVGYSWKNQNGEFQEGVDYINIVAWGPMAENCARYLKKGSGVLVEGKIRTNSYDARDGSGKRYTTEIWADTIQFVGGRRDDNTGNNMGNAGRQQSGYRQPPTGPSFDDANFGQSIQDKGFGDDFPMNFSDIPPDMDGGDKSNESDIPF